MLNDVQNVLSQSPVGVQVVDALAHLAGRAVLAGDGHEGVRQDQRLGQHLLHGIRHAVLVGPLVQRVAGVEQLQPHVSYNKCNRT